MAQKKVKVLLNQFTTYGGVDYPAGEQDLPEDAAKSVVEKKLGSYVEDGSGADADFEPLPFEEMMKRFEKGDSSAEVFDSLRFYQPVIAESKTSGKSVQELLEAKSAEGATGKGKDGDKKKDEGDGNKSEGLPNDFPRKHIFEAPNALSKTGFKTVEEIQKFSRDDLISIDGISDKSADAALAYGK